MRPLILIIGLIIFLGCSTGENNVDNNVHKLCSDRLSWNCKVSTVQSCTNVHGNTVYKAIFPCSNTTRYIDAKGEYLTECTNKVRELCDSLALYVCDSENVCT